MGSLGGAVWRWRWRWRRRGAGCVCAAFRAVLLRRGGRCPGRRFGVLPVVVQDRVLVQTVQPWSSAVAVLGQSVNMPVVATTGA